MIVSSSGQILPSELPTIMETAPKGVSDGEIEER